MDSKDQNLNVTQTKWINFCLFQSIFVCWEGIYFTKTHIEFCTPIGYPFPA